MVYPIKNNQKIIPNKENLFILLNGIITIEKDGNINPIPSKSYFFFDTEFDIVAASPFVEGFVAKLNEHDLKTFPDLEKELSNINNSFEVLKIKNYDNKKSKIHSLLKAKNNSRLLESYTHVLWSEFIGDFKNNLKEQSITAQFSELIDQNIEHNYCAGTYAVMMEIPLKKLIHEIKQTENKTPCKFITEKVINKAKHKLLNTKDTSQMIAYQLGFNDPYYFIKYFKKHTKFTPTQFRTQNSVT
ncbi:AraC family transcriptional regulator [Tenacibaculum ascidiaceicola]|uniref:AraC family transcriptional regulator n=1 Tax=Tenacibaculum ascidiaceicola TaxID=1699411 RepID=UPI0039EB1660